MSYQSMKAAFLNLISRGQRERVQAKEASFDPVEFERTFWAQPNDAAKYVYFRSAASFSQADALLNSTTKNFGQWVNAMSYNALLGGFNPAYLRWTPQGIIGPNGPLPRDAIMTWATVGGVPAFNGELTRG
jgi:hypothetical protein